MEDIKLRKKLRKMIDEFIRENGVVPPQDLIRFWRKKLINNEEVVENGLLE